VRDAEIDRDKDTEREREREKALLCLTSVRLNFLPLLQGMRPLAQLHLYSCNKREGEQKDYDEKYGRGHAGSLPLYSLEMTQR
jgi:hypothetical protein